jgi:ubiquitin carboxyl-terminal hydrolase 4/11
MEISRTNTVICPPAGISQEIMPDQHWYILPASWLRTLRILATNDSKANSPASLSDLSHPDLEPLINSPLYEESSSIGPNGEGLFFRSQPARGELHEGGWRVKDTLVEEESGDMVFVPAETWEKIVRWYGASKPPSGLLRCTQSNDQGEVVIEVNPPTLLLHRTVADNETLPTSQPLRITTSKFAQLSDLHRSAKEALGIDLQEKSRLWKLEMPPAVLTETPSTASGSVMDVRPPTYGDSTTPPSVGVPAKRLPSLSAKLLVSQPREVEGKRGGLEDDPLVEDALLDSGDCLAIEQANLGAWSIEVGEEGQAEEKVKARPPLFTQPFAFSGSGNGVASSSKLAPPAGVTTRSQMAAAGSSKAKTRGLRGLQNLGNTCFMNSALQCLSNTKELSEYFQSEEYLSEVNKTNPLGMHGRVALTFGNLIKEIWDPSGGASSNSYYSGNSVTPREFKLTIGKFAPSFAGYGQQDTQELLAFLLDGLHEDLNRIYKKPYIEKPDWKDGGTNEDLARMGKECWDGYRKRNDSIIVDLFQGQLKSTLICPDCKKVRNVWHSYYR